MRSALITLVSLALLTATATAQQGTGTPRVSPFDPPAGEAGSPRTDRFKAAPPQRKKSSGPTTRTAGDWIVVAGKARRRELPEHSADVKTVTAVVKATGALSMELGGHYVRLPVISDISAGLLVTAGAPLIGKQLRVLIDDREISRVVLPPFQWVEDPKQPLDPAKSVVRYNVKLDPAELQNAKLIKASVLIDGIEQVFYQDSLVDTGLAIRHLVDAGGPPEYQRGPSAKRPRCSPDTLIAQIPCCAGCAD